MKVILLAAVTSLFSLSITPLHKSVAKGGVKRLSDALSSLYAVPSMLNNDGCQNATRYAFNITITTCGQDKAERRIQSVKEKSFKIENPHF